jgi:hypothetical protein
MEKSCKEVLPESRGPAIPVERSRQLVRSLGEDNAAVLLADEDHAMAF